MAHEIEQVVERGICIGCGACSVRTGGRIPVTIGRYGMHQADLTGVGEADRRAASRVCPMSDAARNEDDLSTERYPNLPLDPRTGPYREVIAGRLFDDSALLDSSSGGLTSFLLRELLRRGDVDGVIHVGRDGDESLFRYRISTSIAELEASKKSAYYSTTFAGVVDKVKGDGRRYAVVGVPCFIKALRLLASEVPEYENQFALYVGLVCGHLKSQFFAESLGWQAGVAPQDLARMDFRRKNPSRSSGDYDYEATDTAGRSRVKATAGTIDGNWGYGAFQPEGCNFCDDVFAESADVAFADAWIPKYVSDWRGTNIVLIRSELVSRIFAEARERGEITVDESSVNDAVQSQAGNFRHRRDGLQVRLADDIADSLSVPRKRVEPGYPVPPSRVALLRQRRSMSRLSLETFAAAKAAGDFRVYAKPMRKAIAVYNRLSPAPLGARLKRVVKRALRSFR